MKIKERKVSIDGLTVYYKCVGNPTATPVVFLHGIGGSYSGETRVDKLLLELGKHFRVYAPGHPGQKHSDPPRRPWGSQEYSDYIREFIGKLGIQNPVIWGQSFGARVAASYAGRYQDIRLLVLSGPAIGFPDLWLYRIVAYHLIVPCLEFCLSSKWSPGLLKKHMVSRYLSVPGKIDFRKYEVMGKTLGKFMRENMLGYLQKQLIKVVFIWGSNDWIIPVAQGRAWHGRLPTSKYYELDGSHFVIYEKTGEVIDILKAGL